MPNIKPSNFIKQNVELEFTPKTLVKFVALSKKRYRLRSEIVGADNGRATRTRATS